MPEDNFLIIFQAISGFILGAIIGSFLTMLTYRLPRKLSIVAPRSFCPSCKNTLGVPDLVPIFSYLFNKGACRRCGAEIGRRYLAIEAGSALAGLVIALHFGFTIEALAAAIIFYSLYSWALIKMKI